MPLKQLKTKFPGGGCLWSGTDQTAQLRAMGIVLGASRGCAICTFIIVGTYRLGAEPPKNPNFGDRAVFFVLAVYGSTSFSRGSTQSSNLCCSESPDPMQSV